MSFVAGYAVPHPPLIIPDVGRGEEKQIQKTVDAYKEVARRVAEHKPDTIILTSPHAPAYYNAFAICPGKTLYGTMAKFRAPDAQAFANVDCEFVETAEALAAQYGVPLMSSGWRDAPMDHATLIPLYFINQAYVNYQLVVIGLSGLPESVHYQLGLILQKVVQDLGRKTVFIASGDLSHKLKPDGPYGFAQEGPIFDSLITEKFAKGDLAGIMKIDSEIAEGAAECGLLSFDIMAGALSGLNSKGELLSYEGPFGVGYGVAAFEVPEESGAAVDRETTE